MILTALTRREDRTILSASGVLLDAPRGIILTSKTLLSPFVEELAPPESQTQSKDKTNFSLRPGVLIEVLLDESSVREHFETENDYVEPRKTWRRRKSRPTVPLRSVSRPLQWCRAHVLDSVRCQRIRLALDRVSSSRTHWTSGWPVSTEAIGTTDAARAEAAAAAFWSGFDEIVILEIEQEGDELASRVSAELSKPLLQSALRIDRGLPISFVGSPYGILAPNIFHNSVFNGIVSNVVAINSGRNSVAVSESPTVGTVRWGSSASPSNGAPIIEPDLLMIDQECQPGCEGGPVFDSAGDLVGIMLPPIRPTDGTNVQVQLVAPAAQFLHAVRTKLRRHFGIDESEIAANAKQQALRASNCVASEASVALSAAIQSVVLVSVGSFWASGVVVSSHGDIITSAHLFRPLLSKANPFEPTLRVGNRIDVCLERVPVPGLESSRLRILQRVTQSSATSNAILTESDRSQTLWLSAELTFVSDSHLDVAVLRLSSLPPPSFGALRPIYVKTEVTDRPNRGIAGVGGPSNIPSPAIVATTADLDPKKGERVFVIGYSLFGPSKSTPPSKCLSVDLPSFLELKATCTHGIISGLPRLNGQVQMIHTSCKVDKGASGGAVVDRTGNFLGLVTCNAVTKKGQVISRINFSIPTRQLAPVFQYIRGGCRERWILLPLLEPNADAAAMWKITQNTKPLVPPGLKKLQDAVVAEAGDLPIAKL